MGVMGMESGVMGPWQDCGVDGETEYMEMDASKRYGRYRDVLGKGAFKTVYRAFDEVDGIEVAWNQVKIQDAACSPEDLERLQSEIHLLRTLRHKNVIKFYHSWVDTNNMNMNFITEIFTSGTLRQYRKKHKHVDIKAVKNWARQILRGLLYLHSHDPPIIHRDLKCDNIFINGNHGEVKIGDLGLATILRQAHAAHSVIGTLEFMAPELYEEDYNELADIYSFGMCLLEMVTSEYPYSECTNAAQIYRKVTSGIKPAALEKVKDLEVRGFIEKCLAPVSKRLPARELLADAFLHLEENREAHECPPLHGTNMTTNSENATLTGIRNKSSDGIVLSPPLSPSNDEEKMATFAKGNDSASISAAECDELSTDEQLRSQDFKVKGKKKDENTIFLRIRIADTEGNLRNIHFLFDLEGDSALSVASEMVEELDLSDQVVTTIADMIDSEVIALVPGWNSGTSFDEMENSQEELVLPPLERSDETKSVLNPSYQSGSLERPLAVRIALRSKSSSLSSSSLARGEATMFGRFEEVTYNKGDKKLSSSSSFARLVFSSDSSEMFGDEEGDSTEHSPIANDLIQTDEAKYSHASEENQESDTVEHSSIANELTQIDGINKYTPHAFEETRERDTVEQSPIADDLTYMDETKQYTHVFDKTRESDTIEHSPIVNALTYMDETKPYFHAFEQEANKDSFSFEEAIASQMTSKDVILPPGLTDEEEVALNEELETLKTKQGEELRELQSRHRISITDIQNRQRQRGGFVNSLKEYCKSSHQNGGGKSFEPERLSSVEATKLYWDSQDSTDYSDNTDRRQDALSRFLSDASSLANKDSTPETNGNNVVIMSKEQPQKSLTELEAVVEGLRCPQNGCLASHRNSCSSSGGSTTTKNSLA